VRKGKRIANFQKACDEIGEREMAAGFAVALAQLFKDLGKGLSLDVLHRVEGLSFGGDSELVNGNNVRMLELSGELGFCDEALQFFRRKLVAAPQDLHCYRALDALVARTQDEPHAPSPSVPLMWWVSCAISWRIVLNPKFASSSSVRI
jgi:hypothetical protein